MLLEIISKSVSGIGVKTNHRLVKDEYLGVVDKRSHKGDLLLHTVGIRGDRLIYRISKLEHLLELLNTFLTCSYGNTVDVTHKVHVFLTCHFLKENMLVTYVTEVLLCADGILRKIVSCNSDGAHLIVVDLPAPL